MDPRDLDHRLMWVHSYESLPPSPRYLWSAVMPRSPRPSLAQSVPSSDIIDMDEGCWITDALQEHALALHQMMLMQGVVDLSYLRCLQPLTSPGEISGTLPSSSSSRNSSRLACVVAPTLMGNLENANAEISQPCEAVNKQQ